MSALEVWLTIGLMTLATLITRTSLFLLGGAVRLPPRVQHALRYAPAAALAAIVVPDLVLTGGALDVSLANPKLLAGIGAAVFFLATKRLLSTIVLGMALFTALRVML
ncbi:MAG TPA: AzlD domain-containing protein [Paucimonas sp.]|nr:AzlD domain-containing protein [Paucimonas sp.]